MADTPKYSSIIDEFLDSREPSWKDLGLKDARNSGNEWLDRTHDHADIDFLDDIAEGVSHHTNVPPTSKGATLTTRLLDKENAAPRLGAARTADYRTAANSDDYMSAVGDDKSLMEEVTESLEEAAKSGKVEKKHRSDGEIQRYVRQLLNQGVEPIKVAAQLKKLAEIELFNSRAANDYLQKNAGLLGIAYMEPNKTAELELFDKSKNMGNAYLNNSNAGGTGAQVLEPNTFMDENNPNYERTAGKTEPYTIRVHESQKELLPDWCPSCYGENSETCPDCKGIDKTRIVPSAKEKAEGNHTGANKEAYGFNSQSELKALRESGGVISTISAGDRVTIRIPAGRGMNGQEWKEATGRAVMFGPGGWVLNMGGRYGTPGIANEENIVKVRKANSQKSSAAGVWGFDSGGIGMNYHVNQVPRAHVYIPSATKKGICAACNAPKDHSLHKSQKSAAGEEVEDVIDETPIVTPVIFRKWKDTGTVLALFPEDLGTNDPYSCSSYEHVGGHSSADPQGCIHNTVPASPAEYADLKRELENLGYKLKPMSRLQYNAIETRKTKLKQYYSAPDEGERTFSNEGQGSRKTIVETREHTASSNDCVRQAKAWKAAGIQPRAKSVKQITACSDCSYFKKNGNSKTCSLYGLPIVGNGAELNAVVNRMTAGVPKEQKKAALVQIANHQPERVQQKTASEGEQIHKDASFTHERRQGVPEVLHFSGSMIQKLHTAGHSLKKICTAAEKRFGLLETSKGVREFIASLHKEKGKIIMATADADYLKKIGIHNEAIVGAVKCASCKSHSGKEAHKVASTDMVTRAPDTFVQATPAHIRSTQPKAVSNFDSASVAKLHAAGHNVDKIFKAASSKYGSAQTSKAIRDWVYSLKDTKTALSQVDCTMLKKLGVKLNDTLLGTPVRAQITPAKKVAAGAPEDGRAILKEFDLMGIAAQDDIDMTPPARAELDIKDNA